MGSKVGGRCGFVQSHFKKKGFLFYVCRSRCANNIDVITWNLIGTGSMRERKIEEESWRDAVLRGEWNGV